jgi:hypothetical protein
MIRQIVASSTRWVPQLKCSSACVPSSSNTHTFARNFFANIPPPSLFIEDSASPRGILAIALKSAVESGKIKRVKFLLETGAKANQAFDDGSFILHHAAEGLHSNIVRELIEGGADVNIKTRKEGNTPLHVACAWDHKLVVEELLQNKAKYTERNNVGNTPLEEAILVQSTDCCKLLYDAGANINEQNLTTGCTPLMTACKLGAYNIVRLLLILGANPDFKQSTSPFPIADIRPDILQLLSTPKA